MHLKQAGVLEETHACSGVAPVICLQDSGADPDLKLDFGKTSLYKFQSFQTSLIYSYRLPKKIKNPGLEQFFKNLWRSQFLLLV